MGRPVTSAASRATSRAAAGLRLATSSSKPRTMMPDGDAAMTWARN
jgi:hypothetical protein